MFVSFRAPRRATTRGASLVETTLLIAFTLIMLYAGIELGVTGYYQISADGAAFISAHQHAENLPTAAPELAAQKVFNHFTMVGPQSDAAYVRVPTAATGTASNSMYPVDYHVQNAWDRIGGAAVVGALMGEQTVSKSAFARLPQFGGRSTPIRVQGVVEDQVPYVIGSHADIGAYTSVASALPSAVAYFGSYEDTPPAMTGRISGPRCAEWIYNPADAGYDSCVDTLQAHSIAYGLAAGLSDVGAGNGKPGITPVSQSSLNASANDVGTFWETLTHQQEYAQFAVDLAKIVWNPSAPSLPLAQRAALPLEGTTGFYGACGSPNCPSGPGPTPNPIAADVRSLCVIYSWDTYDEMYEVGFMLGRTMQNPGNVPAGSCV